MSKNKAETQRGASRNEAPPAPRKPLSHWVWLGGGMVIGAFAMLLVNLKPGGIEIKRSAQSAQPGQPASQDSSQVAKPKYDFYTLLPGSGTFFSEKPAPQPTPTPTPPPVPKPQPPAKPLTPAETARFETARAEAALRGETPPPPPPPPPPPKPKVEAPRNQQYYLQAGSFRKASDADRIRAQLLLLGHGVQVEPGTVRGETWYRVMIGPYTDQQKLSQAQRELAANGYGNLLPQKR